MFGLRPSLKGTFPRMPRAPMLEPSELTSWSSGINGICVLQVHSHELHRWKHDSEYRGARLVPAFLWLPISLGSRFDTSPFRTQDFGKHF
jgi:hypothetical protein